MMGKSHFVRNFSIFLFFYSIAGASLINYFIPQASFEIQAFFIIFFIGIVAMFIAKKSDEGAELVVNLGGNNHDLHLFVLAILFSVVGNLGVSSLFEFMRLANDISRGTVAASSVTLSQAIIFFMVMYISFLFIMIFASAVEKHLKKKSQFAATGKDVHTKQPEQKTLTKEQSWWKSHVHCAVWIAMIFTIVTVIIAGIALIQVLPDIGYTLTHTPDIRYSDLTCNEVKISNEFTKFLTIQCSEQVLGDQKFISYDIIKGYIISPQNITINATMNKDIRAECEVFLQCSYFVSASDAMKVVESATTEVKRNNTNITLNSSLPTNETK